MYVYALTQLKTVYIISYDTQPRLYRKHLLTYTPDDGLMKERPKHVGLMLYVHYNKDYLSCVRPYTYIQLYLIIVFINTTGMLPQR
jgi:hypothetical protein